MRTDNRSLVLATLGGLFTAMACTLITDVDRQKIQPPTGEGGEGASGGSSGKGGAGGTAGKGGSAGKAGSAGTGGAGSGGTSQGGESGEGGVPATGGTGGGGTGGTGGMDVAGAGGESGAAAVCGNGVMESGEACDDGNTASCGTCSADCAATRTIPAGSDASLTIGAGTNIADGDTITINDGSDTAVLEFECDPVGDCPGATDGVTSGNIEVTFNATNFDGLNDATEYRDILIAAIDAAGLLTDADDGGASPATVSLTGVEAISDTVGAPTFESAARCRATRTCSTDNVCLSNDCSAGVCQ
jgi:cysteine-rich repeat protein